MNVWRSGIKALQKMVKNHLTVPYEFVCVTDMPGEFTGKQIKVVPLDRTIWVPGTMYMKLMFWRRDIGSIIGERMLYLDLDCVITGSLDQIVNRSEDIVLWRNQHLQRDERYPVYDASIMLITAGARPQLYEDFDPKVHPKQMKRKWGGDDQEWMNHKLNRTDEAYWTEADGIHDVRKIKQKLPNNARIVFFPGRHIPQLQKAKKQYPWILKYLT